MLKEGALCGALDSLTNPKLFKLCDIVGLLYLRGDKLKDILLDQFRLYMQWA